MIDDIQAYIYFSVLLYSLGCFSVFIKDKIINASSLYSVVVLICWKVFNRIEAIGILSGIVIVFVAALLLTDKQNKIFRHVQRIHLFVFLLNLSGFIGGVLIIAYTYNSPAGYIVFAGLFIVSLIIYLWNLKK